MLRITANLALSADGKSAARGQPGSGFGSPEDHRRLLALRAAADAVLVGHGTLLADDMSLGLGSAPEAYSACRRAAGKPDLPARCVAAFSRPLPPDHKLFRSPGGPIHLFLGPAAAAPPAPACHIHPLASQEDLLPALQSAARQAGWSHLHCEGGPGLLRHLLAADAIDTLHLTITPRIFGGHSAPTLCNSLPSPTFQSSTRLALSAFEPIDAELFLTYSRQ